MKWTRERFMKEFGEDPVDMFGDDWENCIEEYIEQQKEDEFNNKFGVA